MDSEEERWEDERAVELWTALKKVQRGQAANTDPALAAQYTERLRLMQAHLKQCRCYSNDNDLPYPECFDGDFVITASLDEAYGVPP